MTVWHIVLYAIATVIALSSFIQLAERREDKPRIVRGVRKAV